MMDNNTLMTLLSLFGNAKALISAAVSTKRNGLSTSLQLQNTTFDLVAAVKLLLATGAPRVVLAKLLLKVKQYGFWAVLSAIAVAIVRHAIRRRAYSRSLRIARDPHMDEVVESLVEGRADLLDTSRVVAAREALEQYDHIRSETVIRRSWADYQDQLMESLGRDPHMTDFVMMSLPTLGDFRSLDPGALRSLLLRLLHGYHDKHRELAPLLAVHRAYILQYTGDTFVQLGDRFSRESTVSSGCRVLLCDLHLWVSRRCGALADQLPAAAVVLRGALQALRAHT